MAKTKKQAKKAGGGPFLAAAVFAEAIIEDTSKKLSVLGVMDGTLFYIGPDAPPGAPSKEHPIQFLQHALISFKTGDSPGKHRLKLVLHMPSGSKRDVYDKEVEFSNPPQGGFNLRTQASFEVHSTGVYWVDVILDGKRMTRMPLNISVQRIPLPSDTTTGGHAKQKKKKKGSVK